VEGVLRYTFYGCSQSRSGFELPRIVVRLIIRCKRHPRRVGRSAITGHPAILNERVQSIGCCD
jgi:hypothetical protein